MMQKKIGSILLVAGTCIGSGMIALPMVLAKIGLVPSFILTIIIWALMYFTSLISLELNLQANQGLSLGDLGKHFSGSTAKTLGVISLKLLSYSLLAVFIYGGSSIVQKLMDSTLDLKIIVSWYALAALLLLLLPIKLLDYLNRSLFIGLIGALMILVIGLTSMIQWQNLPWFAETFKNFSVWKLLIPVVFTSFGFQVIFHTLTNYCHKEKKILKKAFFWGSLIPAIVYIVWTASVLSVVQDKSPLFYQRMMFEKIEVGDLVAELSRIAYWQSVQLFVGWISLLAIITSVLGVGVGLCDSIKNILSPWILNPYIRSLSAATITILPAYLIAIWVPNAFITVLGFAGMILVIIAILLPSYLFFKAKLSTVYYPELKHRGLIFLSILIGILIIGCELSNMLD